jgi:thymidylate synthase
MEIHTLELPKLPVEEDGTPLWEWMKFLNANSKEDLKMVAEKNQTIKKAVSALEKISEDQKARWAYDNQQKWLWDQTAREREAMAKVRDQLNQLFSMLIRDNRQEDLLRSTSGPEYQKQLLNEYHLV